jgi:hypothetical protein
MFCSGANLLSQPKNLTAFSASSKTFFRHKNLFYWMQILFLSGTKCLWLAHYVYKFLGWLKKFGPAQNILGPVEGQGNSCLQFSLCNKMSDVDHEIIMCHKTNYIHLFQNSYNLQPPTQGRLKKNLVL